MPPDPSSDALNGGAFAPFRQAVITGLTVVLPPLLTVVIFLWAWGTLNSYVLTYIEDGARRAILYFTADIRAAADVTQESPPPENILVDNQAFRRVGVDKYVPMEVYRQAVAALDGEPPPQSAHRVYEIYINHHYLKPQIVVPIFLCLFVLLMYVLGKFMAAGVGRFFWGLFERGLLRLPMIRNVYSSVKQVTEFMLSENELEFTRVVAVEYPRDGMWSLGFVMGEGLLDVAKAANEPVLTVLLPTSPMPVTGYAAMFRKSEVIDLNISVEDALQYIVSCGVVVPRHQWISPPTAGRVPAEDLLEQSPTSESHNAGKREPT